MKDVVAALLQRGKEFLICQRPPTAELPMMWEFPGGKVEPGESGPEALVRECREELQIEIVPGRELMQTEYMNPGGDVRLTFYEAAIAKGEPVRVEHNDMRWITPDDMDQYVFCPADMDFVAYLRGRESTDGTES